MDVRSIHGYRGFVTITDEFSKFRWVILIKTRAEVPEKLMKLFKYTFREFDFKVQKIRSDNGSEFTNKKLASFLESYGIIHEFSQPYTPEENGIAERSNALILHGARVMLINSSLPKKYWEFAVKMKTFLLNRTMNSRKKITPFEIAYNKKA